MPPARSAGLIVYRHRDGELQVLLGHMGGPFWARKDDHAWSIPKGEYDDEDAWAAARREFIEELGHPPPAGEPIELGSVTQRGGKVVTAYAIEGDLDAETTVSNTFTMEWPRGSGRLQEFAEIDRNEWVAVGDAERRLVTGQFELVSRLVERLRG